MLDGLTAADFRRHIGQFYRLVQPGEATLEVALVEVTDLAAGAPGRRSPFTVEFAAPPGTSLPQRIYRLEHPAEAEAPLELFLVPLGPKPGSGAMRYEAVFT